MIHLCHAKGCTSPVDPKLFMCLTHWRKLPREHRDNVWFHYRPGQEEYKNPTPEYLEAATAAIQALAELEGK